jgi:hypothetical protein
VFSERTLIMSAAVKNMTEVNPTSRYISTLLIKFVSEFLVFAVKKYDLSVQEISIISFVLTECYRDLIKDPFIIQNYGTEEHPVPESFLTPATLKSVHLNLGMSRETARRKLESLVERGFLTRSKRGYAYPVKIGQADSHAEFRAFLVGKSRELRDFLNKTAG